MTISTINTYSLYWIGLALLLFPIQLKIIAPYGRHIRSKWGVTIYNRLGWIMMELVSPLVFAYVFLLSQSANSITYFIFGLWIAHYFNRSLIYPLRTKTKGKRIPLFIVFSAIFFNSVNAFLNATYLGKFGYQYTSDWLYDPRFIMGLGLFLLGAVINIQSDNILLNLRKPGERDYKIPKGSLFTYISCPNHFGEILEWAGFAVLCWNLPALSFAVWTTANLIPRAWAHHRWYRQTFSDYPVERKAVIPFLF